MANETRPRRESSGPPRIRKPIGSSGHQASDEQASAGSPQGFSGPSDSLPTQGESQRERQGARASTAKRRPPIASRSASSGSAIASQCVNWCESDPSVSPDCRYASGLPAIGRSATVVRFTATESRSFATATATETVTETGKPRLRHRLASVRGMPMPAETFASVPIASYLFQHAIATTSPPSGPSGPQRPPTSRFRLSFPKKRKTSSATPPFTIATKTSSAARSISPSFRR